MIKYVGKGGILSLKTYQVTLLLLGIEIGLECSYIGCLGCTIVGYDYGNFSCCGGSTSLFC